MDTYGLRRSPILAHFQNTPDNLWRWCGVVCVCGGWCGVVGVWRVVWRVVWWVCGGWCGGCRVCVTDVVNGLAC